MNAKTHVTQIHYDRSTSAQIFDCLREDIVSMSLTPGQKLSESQLAERFNVSRTPVREALARLVELGFVEVRPQRGSFVTSLSVQSILESRFIREAIEVAVVNTLADTAASHDFSAAHANLKEQEAAAEARDSALFLRLDDAFHQLLANATGFPKSASVIEAEKAHMDRVRNLSLKELEGQYAQVIRQHRAILDAIEAGDAARARNAMMTHLNEVHHILHIAPEKYPEYFK